MRLNDNWKLNKQDFKIVYITEGCYRVQACERFLWIFKRWIYLTCQETENADERYMEFVSFKGATDFIDQIAE